ncbi:MAG: beta family protein [Phycisphaerales bacterium]
MFDRKHYVPVLKAKQGELAAMSFVKHKSAVTPLLEVVPPGSMTLENRLKKTAKAIERNWGTDHPFFIDFIFLDEDDDESEGEHTLSKALALLSETECKPIPVTGSGRSPAYQAALKEYLKESESKDICIRLTPYDFEDEEQLQLTLDRLMGLLEVDTSSIHIIIDMGSVEGVGTSTLLQVHRANCGMMPRLLEWKTFTIAAGSFPASIAPLTRNQWNHISRSDWLAWQSLLTTTKLARKPSYGDYSISHPSLPPDGITKILAQLRYSTPSDFMVWKGKDAFDYGFEQFFDICDNLRNLPEYRGAGFSEGDRVIDEKATKRDSPGNAGTWRQIGTSHHIEVVVDQISNHPSI